jgi:SAM-dependent methyltransferase
VTDQAPAYPGMIYGVRASRAFLARAVRYLAAEAGIRQFLDIGAGIPAAGNVHEIAQLVAPDARVVYVDNDPIVQVHASALLADDDNTNIVFADLREPEAILAHPDVQALIDFAEPAALLLVAVMHFLTDKEDPAGIIRVLAEALAPGSYLVLTHGTADFHLAGAVSQATAAYDRATAPLVLRGYAQISTFLDGFDLVEPGLVQVPLWRPEARLPPNLDKIAFYGGAGRKPVTG